MKKTFHSIIVALVASGAISLQAAEGVQAPSGLVIYRTSGDVQQVSGGQQSQLQRGDIVYANSAVVTGANGGKTKASIFPGSSVTLYGDNASLAVQQMGIKAQGGLVTAYDASLNLTAGSMNLDVSRGAAGITNSVTVKVPHGVIRPEADATHNTHISVVVTEDNLIVACYSGVAYLEFDHGIPNHLYPNGTQEGDEKVVIMIPAGMALDYNDYLNSGSVSLISTVAKGGLIDEVPPGENDPLLPDNEDPQGVVSPAS